MTEDEIKTVLSRAEEIHLHGVSYSDTDVVIKAAEEAGLPREVIEQALREQFNHFSEPVKAGDLVFARSSDGRHYVAEVTSQIAAGYKVKFLNGSESIVLEQSMRPCEFLPGDKLSVNWPGWGWWIVSVVSFDSSTRQVRLTDGWYEKQFSISEVRIDSPKKPHEIRRAMLLMYSGLIVTGSILGAIVTWLLMR